MEVCEWNNSISDVCLSASSGSYIAKYHAEVQLDSGEGDAMIEVITTVPENADPRLLQATVASIRRGAASVLRPRGLRAHIRLHNLAIHDVDCRPPKYEAATAEALARALADKV
jgi:hypothetical protein